jgi:hypothetical protein
MKYLFLFFLTLFAPLLHASDEVVTPELLILLDHFHIQHDGTLASINEATQKAWLRPSGKERWQTKDNYSAADREVVLEYYTKTGKLQEKKPTKSAYQYGVLCGAATSRMKNRLGYFEKLGLQIGEVVLLSGARPLDPKVDEILPGCQTEGDAFMELWKASPLFFTTPWKHLQHPMIAVEDGSFRRPTTYDTFVFWLKAEPVGDAVIVTNQPYCCYFEAIAKWAFPTTFKFEVIGEGVNPDSEKTSNLLDNLARWLYFSSKKL